MDSQHADPGPRGVAHELLHRGHHRTVRLERDPARVVKRYHRGGLLGSWSNARSARNEFAILAALSAAGRAVPRPLALATPGDRPQERELAMEWIPQAESLAERLERDPAAGRGPALARSLGRLVAELHGSGLDSGDLHAENFLVDARQRLWAIDFHASRIAPRCKPAQLVRDLAALAAGLRERTSARFRARALRAWWRALRALEPRAAQALAGHADLRALALEARGRDRRLAVVAERAERWLRTSSSCRSFLLDAAAGRPSVAGWTRVDTQPAELAELAERVALDRALDRQALAPRAELAFDLGDRGRALLVASGPARALHATWRHAARLAEHGLPCARPFATWTEHGRAVVALELAPGSRRVEDPWSEPALAGALGSLWGRLCDRGLALSGLHRWPLWLTPAGALCVGFAPALERLAPVQRGLAGAASPRELAQGLAETLPGASAPGAASAAGVFLAAWEAEQSGGRWDAFAADTQRTSAAAVATLAMDDGRRRARGAPEGEA